jgi:ankyrin repeat protein
VGSVNSDQGKGRNLLHIAVQDLRYDIIPVLLKMGVNPDKKNDAGETVWDVANKIQHPVNRQQLLQMMEPYRKKRK